MQITRVQLGQLPKLFHVQTNTYIDLPLNLSVIRIGKPNDRIPPNIDVSNFPNADVVSIVKILKQTIHKCAAFVTASLAFSTIISGISLTTAKSAIALPANAEFQMDGVNGYLNMNLREPERLGRVNSYYRDGTPDPNMILEWDSTSSAWSIRRQRTQRCLNAQYPYYEGGQSAWIGMPVTTFPCNRSYHQLFDLLPTSNGLYMIKHRASGLCVNAPRSSPNTWLTYETCNSNNRSVRWRINDRKYQALIVARADVRDVAQGIKGGYIGHGWVALIKHDKDITSFITYSAWPSVSDIPGLPPYTGPIPTLNHEKDVEQTKQIFTQTIESDWAARTFNISKNKYDWFYNDGYRKTNCKTYFVVSSLLDRQVWGGCNCATMSTANWNLLTGEVFLPLSSNTLFDTPLVLRSQIWKADGIR